MNFKSVRKSASLVRPMFDSDCNCICDICLCSCSVLYCQVESSRLAVQTRDVKEETMDSMSQTSTDASLCLKTYVADMTQQKIEASLDLSYDNVVSMAANSLLENAKMQVNNKAYIDLQRIFEPLKDTVDGESVATVRAENRKEGRNLSIRKIITSQLTKTSK